MNVIGKKALDEGFEFKIRKSSTLRFLALGWHLKEIHMTWAPLEKKRMRLRTYTKVHQELCSQSVETASQALSDAVVIYLVTASEIWRRRHDGADLKWI
ncbi:hypothetical protein Tco_1434124 [Tanacetum coccineum]